MLASTNIFGRFMKQMNGQVTIFVCWGAEAVSKYLDGEKIQSNPGCSTLPGSPYLPPSPPSLSGHGPHLKKQKQNKKPDIVLSHT